MKHKQLGYLLELYYPYLLDAHYVVQYHLHNDCYTIENDYESIEVSTPKNLIYFLIGLCNIVTSKDVLEFFRTPLHSLNFYHFIDTTKSFILTNTHEEYVLQRYSQTVDTVCNILTDNTFTNIT